MRGIDYHSEIETMTIVFAKSLRIWERQCKDTTKWEGLVASTRVQFKDELFELRYGVSYLALRSCISYIQHFVQVWVTSKYLMYCLIFKFLCFHCVWLHWLKSGISVVLNNPESAVFDKILQSSPKTSIIQHTLISNKADIDKCFSHNNVITIQIWQII